MPPIESYTGANDNSPQWSMRGTLKPKRLRRRRFANLLAKKRTVSNQLNTASNWMTLLPVIAFFIGGAAWWYVVPTINMLWPAIVISVSFAALLTFTRQTYVVRNLSSLVLVGAIGTMFVGFLNHEGLTIDASDIAVLTSALGLLTSWALKSRPALMLSCLSAIFWLISLQSGMPELLGLTQVTPGGWNGLIALLIIGQFFTSISFKSNTTLITSIIAACLLIVSSMGEMPVIAFTNMIFA